MLEQVAAVRQTIKFKIIKNLNEEIIDFLNRFFFSWMFRRVCGAHEMWAPEEKKKQFKIKCIKK